jgi:outer membrane protein
MRNRAIRSSGSNSHSVYRSDNYMRKEVVRLDLKKLILGLAMLATWPAAFGADVKIGYVNAVKVIEEAPQAAAALKKLEAEFGPRDRKLVELQGRIKHIEEDLQKNALVVKDTERRAREQELNSLKRDLRRATQEFREDYNLRRNEELASLQKLVQRAIAELAKQEAYDLVLNEGVLYAGPRTDITEKVLRKLGKKAAP